MFKTVLSDLPTKDNLFFLLFDYFKPFSAPYIIATKFANEIAI